MEHEKQGCQLRTDNRVIIYLYLFYCYFIYIHIGKNKQERFYSIENYVEEDGENKNHFPLYVFSYKVGNNIKVDFFL